MTDIYNNTEAFGLMSAEKQEAMRRHIGAHEVFGNKGWARIVGPSFYSDWAYRAVLASRQEGET